MIDKIEIKYINNTCDIDELSGFGEILVLIKDNKPVAHLDYSDTVVEVDVLPDLLKPFGLNLKFTEIKPNKKLIAQVKDYLEEIYGEVD